MVASINDIASKHLGKAGDGSIVKPYITPSVIDSTLLVAVPRYLNRGDYSIDENNLPFIGVDVWNAYEVSALTTNGFPVTGIAKIIYPCNSLSIVESKSLKLYLNSFNMHRLGNTKSEVRKAIIQQITDDLSQLLQTKTEVNFFSNDDIAPIGTPIGFNTTVESEVDISNILFDKFNEDPNTLEYIPNNYGKYQLKCGLLRSNCRITNQPDWGTLYIAIENNIVPSYESLIRYIVSMRKENHFHEEILECVFKRLYDALPSAKIVVGALYTRRGGIDINPIRSNSIEMLKYFDEYLNINNISFKTINQ